MMGMLDLSCCENKLRCVPRSNDGPVYYLACLSRSCKEELVITGSMIKTCYQVACQLQDIFLSGCKCGKAIFRCQKLLSTV